MNAGCCKTWRRPAAAALALALACEAHGASVLVGRVMRVEDGDTVTILDAASRQQGVALAGIDAPALSQPSGNRAKQNLSALLLDQEVSVAWSATDGSGRLVGKVMVAPPSSPCHYQPSCPKTLDAGLEQITAGFAWSRQRYAAEQTQADRAGYQQAEFQAKIHRRGLWAEQNPTPPWQWR